MESGTFLGLFFILHNRVEVQAPGHGLTTDMCIAPTPAGSSLEAPFLMQTLGISASLQLGKLPPAGRQAGILSVSAVRFLLENQVHVYM